MLDESYLKRILQTLGDAGYVGTTNACLWEAFVDDSNDPAEDERNTYKFVYHMDELLKAGLFRPRDTVKFGWGLEKNLANEFSMVEIALVLTPIGGELLEELNQPKGLERLKQAIRSAGDLGGSEALKFGVGELMKMAV